MITYYSFFFNNNFTGQKLNLINDTKYNKLIAIITVIGAFMTIHTLLKTTIKLLKKVGLIIQARFKLLLSRLQVFLLFEQNLRILVLNDEFRKHRIHRWLLKLQLPESPRLVNRKPPSLHHEVLEVQ